MAATAGILNGTDLLVYSGANAISHATTCSLALNADMRDASTKASSGWKAVLPGQKSWQVETQGMIAMDAAYNYAYLLGLITAKTRVMLNFKTTNTNNTYLSGYAYLTSITVDAPNQGNTTYSASFVGDGALTVTNGVNTEITDVDDDFSIDGTDTFIVVTKATAVTGTFVAVASFSGHVVIKNNGVGTCTLIGTGGEYIDGVDSINLTTGQSVTVYPNVTKYEVVSGEYTLPI